MPRTYPQNIEKARQRAAENMAEASRRHPRDTPQWEAEVALLELRDMAARGLPEGVYPGGYHDQNFIGDLWSHLGSVESIRAVLADARFAQIQADLLREDGFDVRAELLAGLAEFEADRMLGGD